MELHPEVYNWLGALQIVDASRPPTINRSGMAALDEDTTMDFENGAVRPATRETRAAGTTKEALWTSLSATKRRGA